MCLLSYRELLRELELRSACHCQSRVASLASPALGELLGEEVRVLAAAHDEAHAPARAQHDEQGGALLLAQPQRLQVLLHQPCA